MKFLATFCLAVVCQTAPAMDRLAALACCESGGCDTVVGPDGERSRYQTAPSVAADFQIDPTRLTNPYLPVPARKRFSPRGSRPSSCVFTVRPTILNLIFCGIAPPDCSPPAAPHPLPRLSVTAPNALPASALNEHIGDKANIPSARRAVSIRVGRVTPHNTRHAF